MIFITSLLLFSCCKERFDDLRNNIIGDWEITQTTQEIRADTVYSEGTIPPFSISFNEDGTGIIETFIGVDAEMEWVYQYNPQIVEISVIQPGILRDVHYYKVVMNKKNSQIWKYEVDPKTGIVDLYKHTWEMKRK